MRRLFATLCVLALTSHLSAAWADSLVERYTEVRSIRTVPADSTRFEVPAGYTRK